jgi:preprotein translocase SecE subunit
VAANNKSDKTKKKSTTMREKAEDNQKDKPSKSRKLKQTAGKVKKPLSSAKSIANKEYYIPMPDNKAGKFLNKKRSFIPKYFKESWRELKMVQWPNRKETTKSTIAVIVFAVVFGLMITVVDYGLDKIFRELLLR